MSAIDIDIDRLVLPKGARIYPVRDVTVRWGRTGLEALEAGAPNTQDLTSIWDIIAQYTPSGTGETVKDFVLLYIPEERCQWQKALEWGEEMKLRNTIPQEILAIGELRPSLVDDLGGDSISVTATTDSVVYSRRCAFSVSWRFEIRVAITPAVADLSHLRNNWFAFRR